MTVDATFHWKPGVLTPAIRRIRMETQTPNLKRPPGAAIARQGSTLGAMRRSLKRSTNRVRVKMLRIFTLTLLTLFLMTLFLTACAPAPEAPTVAAVDTARIAAADTEPHNWLSHGRTYSEQRFSPLTQINVDTVEALGLAWYLDLGTNRGLEATPLVVDGVMYVSGAWNLVHAIDAATGALLWRYDPEVSRPWVAAYAIWWAVR